MPEMKKPKLKTILLTPLALIVVLYLVLTIYIASKNNTVPPSPESPVRLQNIAIFGASGTAGDGILKAALKNPDITNIHVITRRSTPRIEEGVATGRVSVTTHMDYLDYSAIHEQIANVDAVFWAIGLSSIGVDEDTYRRIHVDFPRQFVETWALVSNREDVSFHYISSSDISADSSAMWARVKVEAENTLIELAEDTNIRVICYRPDYIGPTREEAHLGQKILYGFFSPLGVAIKATQIGQAMMEVSTRGREFSNGDKLSNRRIQQFSDAYES